MPKPSEIAMEKCDRCCNYLGALIVLCLGATSFAYWAIDLNFIKFCAAERKASIISVAFNWIPFLGIGSESAYDKCMAPVTGTILLLWAVLFLWGCFMVGSLCSKNKAHNN